MSSGRYDPTPAQLERDIAALQRLLEFALRKSAPTPTQLLMVSAA